MNLLFKNKTNSVYVILNGFVQGLWAASEESHYMIIANMLRFFAILRMTNSLCCHFDRSAAEWRNPLRIKGIIQEISPCVPSARGGSSLSRDDTFINGELLFFGKKLKLVILLFLFAFVLTSTSAQNIMQLNNSWGAINSTIIVPISITNDEEFISFQCDVLLPDGFSYVPGSISLSSRSVDHVVNVTNIENNSIRILSYSLNNTAFLLDSGNVAQFSLSTPSIVGDYIVGINNGIIGNAESVNILDSLKSGEIILTPIGITEDDLPENKIKCFPNPFNENLTIQFDTDSPKQVDVQVFDLKGTPLSYHKLILNNIGINSISFGTHSLLGDKPPNGIYFIHFDFHNGNQAYSIVKKIHLNK